MQPNPSSPLVPRVTFGKLYLKQGETRIECASFDDAIAIALMQPTGRINIRGENGSGKSSLLLALRQRLKGKAFYWPTVDRLSFSYTKFEANDSDDDAGEEPPLHKGFSSGQKQITALEEIVNKTHAKIYLLDEWDANLDANNRAKAQSLIDRLALRARVIEISHRDF
jgi:ABC-type transport system involved in cytochrome c biogenesis ATPase subunit